MVRSRRRRRFRLPLATIIVSALVATEVEVEKPTTAFSAATLSAPAEGGGGRVGGELDDDVNVETSAETRRRGGRVDLNRYRRRRRPPSPVHGGRPSLALLTPHPPTCQGGQASVRSAERMYAAGDSVICAFEISTAGDRATTDNIRVAMAAEHAAVATAENGDCDVGGGAGGGAVLPSRAVVAWKYACSSLTIEGCTSTVSGAVTFSGSLSSSGALPFPPGSYRCYLLLEISTADPMSFPVLASSEAFSVAGEGAPTPPQPPAPPAPLPPPRYVPGDLTVSENDLRLSTGLRSRILAKVGKRVPLDISRPNGRKRSRRRFHADPDGGAVIPHPSGDGRYVYVSNIEERNGGVGAIYFDAWGNVTNYDVILEGLTSYNCGGGLSPWPNKTWLTCEEHSRGQVWEVDPWTKRYQKTTMGLLPRTGEEVDTDGGDKYEAVAFDPDTRDPEGKYRFFITTDSSDGQLIRWTPSDVAIAKAKATSNYWAVLVSEGKQEYLVIHPDGASGKNTGTFSWSTNLKDGRESAFHHFAYNEGIDVHDGYLYFTCKILKRLYILDLDAGRYSWSSTKNGAFDSQPDQIARIVGKGADDLLYFCEDGGGACGVHARDGTSGKFYTILQAMKKDKYGVQTEIYGTETTGLAFSPDRRKMIVSFQCCRIYEIWREDGLPFNAPKGLSAPSLNIKYHQEGGPVAIYRSSELPFSSGMHVADDEHKTRTKDSARSTIK